MSEDEILADFPDLDREDIRDLADLFPDSAHVREHGMDPAADQEI